MRKLIGNRQFYRSTLAIALPIMLQNGVTNFVSLLDNIMVGQVGTEEMSGVSISNQLLFVFNLALFGAISGAGIFTAQFFGSGDDEGVRSTMRFKLLTAAVLSAMGITVLLLWGVPLISLFLSDDATGDIGAALSFGNDYLRIMLVGLLPFALTQSYASTLRETGETRMPMIASICAVFVNLIFNYILIFGHFGAPAIGVDGAAIATVISRFVELAIVLIFTHSQTGRFTFAVGLYRTMRIPLKLIGSIFVKGMPLLVNELLWSSGMTVLTQCYSTRGLAVVAGLNICNTVANLFNVVFFSMGNTVAIMIGQLLGAREFERARDSAAKLIAFSVSLAAVISLLMTASSPFVPLLYNTSDTVRGIATRLLICAAISAPIQAFANASYFTIRSGGKTLITFLFDCCFVWVVSVPLAYCLSRYTAMPIVPLYFICQFAEIFKCLVGFVMVKKGIWVNNIIDTRKTTAAAGE